MKKHFIELFIVITIITSFFSNISYAYKQEPQLASFADIVEPLIPAVVNIYTVKYNKQYLRHDGSLNGLLSFEEFQKFLKQFNIPVTFDAYSDPKVTFLGSGFIIDETGLIVTNHHIIAGSDEIHVKLSDNTEFPAVVVGMGDPKTDLALIKINTPRKLPFVSFGNSTEARIGDVVIAIGNPFGYGSTVTTGIISSKERDLGSSEDELVDDFIQTDAAINIGNSGGPLFNVEGKVIGINTLLPDVAGGTNIGVGFAIPSNRAQAIVDQLKKSGKIARGKLDIAIQENTKELSEALNIDKDYGVLVVDVKIDGAGDKAGLKRGDLILEFNGKKVLNSRKLQLLVAETKIGEEIKLTIIRNGENINLTTTLSEVKDTEEQIKSEEEESPKNVNSKGLLEKSDIVLTNITEDLKNKFNLGEDIKGLFVVAVKSDEKAHSLMVGDIVLAINQEPVEDIEQFELIYEQLKEANKKSIGLLIKRRGFTMFIPLPVK